MCRFGPRLDRPSGDDRSIILVHVIDQEFVGTVVENGFGSREEVPDMLRK